MNRAIGIYKGDKRGPLFICFGAIHGNEPAGVKALERLFQMLAAEPIKNPNFCFKGTMIALRGNLKAAKRQVRYLEKDLNRQWIPTNIARIRKTAYRNLDAEDQELYELLNYIDAAIEEHQPTRLVVLDLHTTTAVGGIFTIPNYETESRRIALELHAPVVVGMMDTLQGTTLHYFKDENFPIPTTAITFESGQHNDPASVNNAVSAIVGCLRAIGCVLSQDVEPKHDDLLLKRSKYLPKETKLIYRHAVRPDDDFKMKAGYKNFQPIKKGEVLATDRRGVIRAMADSLMLMPLYQQQGSDGFFLIKATNSSVNGLASFR